MHYSSIAVFTMEGRRTIGSQNDQIPSILFREANNIKHYVSLKKDKSDNSYKLKLTKVNTIYLVTK